MSSYAAVLRTPHAVRTFGAALIGRLSYGIVFLSLMLAVIGATGSYTVAGAFVAVFGLTSSVLSPLRARLVDRHGPRRALPPMAVAFASALAAIAVTTWHPGAPNLLLYALAAAAGSSTPPLGPVMRSLWSDLLADPSLRQRAFSLDTVAEETLYIVGPLLAGALAAVANPALGVATSACLVLSGTLLLVTSPALHAPESRGTARGPAEGRPAGRAGSGFGAVATLYRPILISAAVGMCLGALSLLVVAFARRADHLAAVAWIEAALAVGSAVGGLAYGTVTWRFTGNIRLPLLSAALGVTFALAGLAPNLHALAAMVGITGLFVSPALTTAYLLAEETAAPNARVQAGAWVNTTFNLANAVGAALVGLLLSALPLNACFAIAAAPAVFSAVVALACPIRSQHERVDAMAR